MTLVFVQNWLTIRIAVFGFKVTTKQILLRLGTPYGGWYIPQSYLDSKMNKTLLSLGVGFDVSFDKELSRAGFNLILVDPLPACISFAQEELAEYQNCSFENLAVSNFDGSEIFFPPKNSDHDAWSSINVQSTSPELSQSFQVVTLDTLLSKYNSQISNGLLYLKMDIEGAEVKVIPELYGGRKPFSFIGIEFDFLSLIPFLNLNRRFRSIVLARKYLKGLDQAGYKLVFTDHFNFFWEGPDHALRQ